MFDRARADMRAFRCQSVHRTVRVQVHSGCPTADKRHLLPMACNPSLAHFLLLLLL